MKGNALPRLLVLDDREGLDPYELLDPDVVPADGALGGVRGASPR